MHRFTHLYGWWTPEKAENPSENPKHTAIQVEEPSKHSSKNEGNLDKGSAVGDLIFCILLTVMWTTVFLSFGNFVPNRSASEEITLKDYIYLVCFIVLAIVALFDVYYQHLLVKTARSLPKSRVSSKETSKKSCVLRIRLAKQEEKEFIETELAWNQLDFDSLLDVCCKELAIDNKESVIRIRKLPDSVWCTLVRTNADVNRFRRVEYLEFVVVV